MISVRHRTASGDLSASWEFDSARRAVDVSIRRGNRTLEFRVDVCSSSRPRAFAYSVQRVAGDSWRIVPQRFIPTHVNLRAVEAPIHVDLGFESITLTNAPAFEDGELECL